MLNTIDKIIKHKVGLLNLADELGTVSKTCQGMGMSRDTFYRHKSAVNDGGVEALFERTRRKPNLANRVDRATEGAEIKDNQPFNDGFAAAMKSVYKTHPDDLDVAIVYTEAMMNRTLN